MTVPSFSKAPAGHQSAKPRIQMLEVKDRNCPENETLAWILIERDEVYNHDPLTGNLYKAAINLYYCRISDKFPSWHEKRLRFYGEYFPNSFVCITSGGDVCMEIDELRGQRIGTYLMNEIVQWAKQWPEADLRTIHLSAAQAGPDNKDRRNRLYEQFNIHFHYQDSEHCGGMSLPMKAKELAVNEEWKRNIKEHDMLNYLTEHHRTLMRLTWTLQNRNWRLEQLDAEIERINSRQLIQLFKEIYEKHIYFLRIIIFVTMCLLLAIFV